MHHYWTNTLDPIAFRLFGNVAIRWYGLAYFTGFVAVFWLLALYYKKKRSPLDETLQARYVFVFIVGVLVGGRLGNTLFYSIDDLWTNPLRILQIWKPGMASHGGFIGVILATVWFCWSQKQRLLVVSDIVCTLPAVGFFLGRLANFVNGELWGKPSELPWAVIFPHSPLPLVPRHPSQLYEAALEGLFVLAYTQLRFWRSDICKKHPGHLAGEFLIVYAVGRIFCDFFREADAPLILNMPRGTFLSLLLIGCGLGVIVWARCSSRKTVS